MHISSAHILSYSTATDFSTLNSLVKVNNILKYGFDWRDGFCSSSFWFNPKIFLGPLAVNVLYVDIHDLSLTMKDVCSTILPLIKLLNIQFLHDVITNITNKELNFIKYTKDLFVWFEHMNVDYTIKSWYMWLLNNKEASLIIAQLPIILDFVRSNSYSVVIVFVFC